MNRDDLQELSNLRIREAKILLKAAQYSGAYYLAGYSIECALKACIARGTRRYDFPDRGKVNSSFTHNLPELAKIANLKAEIDLATSASRQFASRWTAVCNWNESSRYGLYTRDDAEEIITAISMRGEGVLPWIKRRW